MFQIIIGMYLLSTRNVVVVAAAAAAAAAAGGSVVDRRWCWSSNALTTVASGWLLTRNGSVRWWHF